MSTAPPERAGVRAHDRRDDAGAPSRSCSTSSGRSRRPQSFKKDALVVDTHLYDEADRDFEGVLGRARPASSSPGSSDWDTILEWDLPFAKWFVGGQLNVSYNCLDRHVEAGQGDKVAYHWEGEPGDTRTITYADLLAEVQRFANVLKSPRGRAGATG